MSASTHPSRPQELSGGPSVLSRCVVDRCTHRDRLASTFLAHARDGGAQQFQVWSVHADQVTCSEQATAVFSEEMERTRSVEHPAIPRLLAYEADEGAPVVLTRHAEGRSLREIINLRGRLFPDETVRVLSVVASALEAMHACMPPILHRGVCPERVIVRERDSRVWLEQCGFLHALVAAGMISDKAAVGAAPPGYHVPDELVQTPGPEMDTFALTVVAFEALTGQLPFGTLSSTELSAALRGAYLPSACALRSALPVAVDEVFEQAWAVHRASGHTTPESFMRDLARALGVRASERPTMPNAMADNPPEAKPGDAPAKTGDAPPSTAPSPRTPSPPATSTADEVERAFDSMLSSSEAAALARNPNKRTGEYGAILVDAPQPVAKTPSEVRKAVLGVFSEKPTLLGTPLAVSTPPSGEEPLRPIFAPRAERPKTGPRGAATSTATEKPAAESASPEVEQKHPPLGGQGELSGVTTSSIEKAADLTSDAVLDETSNVGKLPTSDPNATMQMDEALVEALRHSEGATQTATSDAKGAAKDGRSGAFRPASSRREGEMPPPPAAGTRPSARPPSPSSRPRGGASAPPRPITAPKAHPPVRTPSVPFPSAVRKVLATATPSAVSTATTSSTGAATSSTSPPGTASTSPSTVGVPSSTAITTPYRAVNTGTLAEAGVKSSDVAAPSADDSGKTPAVPGTNVLIPPAPRMPEGVDAASVGATQSPSPAELAEASKDAAEPSSPTLSLDDIRSVSDVVVPESPIGDAPTLMAESLVVPKLPAEEASDRNDPTAPLVVTGRPLAVDSQEETLRVRADDAKALAALPDARAVKDPVPARTTASPVRAATPVATPKHPTPVPPPKHPTPVPLPKHPTPTSVPSRSSVRSMPTPVPRGSLNPGTEETPELPTAPYPTAGAPGAPAPAPESTPWMQVARFVGTLTFLSSVIVAGVLIYGLRVADNLIAEAARLQRRGAPVDTTAAHDAGAPLGSLASLTTDAATPAVATDAGVTTSVAPAATDAGLRVASAPDVTAAPADVSATAAASVRDASATTAAAGDAGAAAPVGVPGDDVKLRLAGLIRPGLNDCIEGVESARPVVMTLRFDGPTGAVSHIRLHGIFDEPPLGPCIEEHVNRVARVDPFPAAFWEPTFVFPVPQPRWRPPPPH